MNIGKITKIEQYPIPEKIPIKPLPTAPKPDEDKRPIPVPNWPTKAPVKTPEKVPA